MGAKCLVNFLQPAKDILDKIESYSKKFNKTKNNCKKKKNSVIFQTGQLNN